jgi:hypothetical protein
MRPWGIVKRRGAARTLLCDFDQQRRPPLGPLCATLKLLGVVPTGVAYERSTSGHWHVEIRTAFALTSGEQVATQMALGSDMGRERYNLARIICGARRDDWNLLFARKCR